MKKIKLIFLLALALLSLSACSFLNDVNESLDYVNSATDHINELTSFAEEAPALIQAASTDPEIKKELGTQLETLKQNIEEFIQLEEIPSIAENIHQDLVAKNEILLDEINNVIVNGQVALDKLENSQIISTVNDASDLLTELNNLVP